MHIHRRRAYTKFEKLKLSAYHVGVRPEGFCSIGDTEKPASDISDTQLIAQLFDLPNLHLERQERDYGRLKAVGKVSAGIGISILPPHVQGAPIIARGLSIVKDIVKYEFLS
jgi:hypothetical protein